MNKLYADEDGFIYCLQYLASDLQYFILNSFSKFSKVPNNWPLYMYADKFTPKNIWELFGEPGNVGVFRGSQSRRHLEEKRRENTQNSLRKPTRRNKPHGKI